MEAPFQLGALDFSMCIQGVTPAEALRDTLRLAQDLEALGYSRYWMAEHHDVEVAHSSPEVLTPLLASGTKRIRVGAGGLLLRYYSPFKVAKDFRVLETLFPGRIDLGIARGLAGDPTTCRFMLDGRPADDNFDSRVKDLFGFLRGTAEVTLNPVDATSPEVWLLGTGRHSMSLAALHGAAFCFSQFIPPLADGPEIINEYRERFTPSPGLSAPRWSIAVGGVCAETEEEARRLLARPAIRAVAATVVGSPLQCRQKFMALRERFGTSEFIFCDICLGYEERLKSYRLLAEALEIAPTPPAAS